MTAEFVTRALSVEPDAMAPDVTAPEAIALDVTAPVPSFKAVTAPFAI